MPTEKVPVWIKNSEGKECIRIKDYLHSSKEDNWETAMKYGFIEDYDDDGEFMQNFRGNLYEVEFELEVYKDGTSKIIKVDDRKVLEQE